MQRQYSGTAGRIENCQIGVFLAYATARGHAFVDRALYLPESWIADRPRRREAGIPATVGFRTKPQLRQTMLACALTAGLAPAWVLGDTVYGNDRALRSWLETQQAFLLAIRSDERVWVWRHGAPRQLNVGAVADALPATASSRARAGSVAIKKPPDVRTTGQ